MLKWRFQPMNMRHHAHPVIFPAHRRVAFGLRRDTIIFHQVPQKREHHYLSLRAKGVYRKRIKVPLKSIMWEQVIEAVQRENSKLACSVDSAKSGTVKLLGAGCEVA